MRGGIALSLGLAGVALAALLAVGLRAPPASERRPAEGVAGFAVSGNGLTLTSAAVALPDDPAHFPAGSGAELAEARCTACHSATMALTQPAMDAAKWAGVIKKMRETYGAQVADADVPILTAYLAAMSGGANGPTATTGGPADAHGVPSSQTTTR